MCDEVKRILRYHHSYILYLLWIIRRINKILLTYSIFQLIDERDWNEIVVCVVYHSGVNYNFKKQFQIAA